MNDDALALFGCAAALCTAGVFLAISHPLGRLLRSSARQRAERRAVSFQISETAAPRAAAPRTTSGGRKAA